MVAAPSSLLENGSWNVLIARRTDGRRARWVLAHEGDFFPETVADYIEPMRQFVLAGDSRLERFHTPVRLDVDLTQHCNSACTFCFSAPYRGTNSRHFHIRKRELEPWLRDLASSGVTKTVRLCGGGEPFTHPEIDQILPLAHKHGLLQTVITNLDLVDETRCAAIFDHVDHLRWSVNAASDELRSAIHRPRPGANPLHRSIELVSTLIERRRRVCSEQRRPEIWATYMLLPESVGEIPQFAMLMRSIGVDSVSFRPVLTGNPPLWDTATKTRLYEVLTDVRRLHSPPDFCVYTPRRSLEEAANLNPSDHFTQCLSRRLRAVVEAGPDGPACQACGIYRGTGVHPGHGVSPHESIRDVWARVSKVTFPRNPPADCARCIDVSINRTLEFIFDVLLEDPKAQFERGFTPLVGDDCAKGKERDCNFGERRIGGS